MKDFKYLIFILILFITSCCIRTTNEEASNIAIEYANIMQYDIDEVYCATSMLEGANFCLITNKDPKKKELFMKCKSCGCVLINHYAGVAIEIY